MTEAKRIALDAANKAWTGVWHAHDDEAGRVTLVGDMCCVAKYTPGTHGYEWEILGQKNKKFVTLLLHFLNGGS